MLPTPNLDDRTFQNLVDEAKRLVQRKWPEWTGWSDHNVSDPGVTLIETFAYMVDQLLYRLNRVPDRTYIKLLELIGLQLQPPTAAVAPVTFWLSAPQPIDVAVPRGTEVATERTETTEAVVFRSRTDLSIRTCKLQAVAAAPARGAILDLTDPLSAAEEVPLFSNRPTPGDCFYVGLSTAVPSCVVALRFSGRVEGYGINPDKPPRQWQAWNGREWQVCDLERDETGGFNRAGVVVVHLPRRHTASIVGERQAGWLRCVITAPEPGQPTYEASPKIRGLEAFTVGGTVDVTHGEEIVGEFLGTAEGVSGQSFRLQRSPVVAGEQPEVIEIEVDTTGEDGNTKPVVTEWVRVDSFAEKKETDRCFVIEPMQGTVRFPPAVREPDGKIRFFGAVPPAGARVRIRSYLTGGGRVGNVSAHALRSLRSSMPSINSIDNRLPASGGVDGESIDEAKERGPLLLRTRDRAVTTADFEHLAREAAPQVARVKCLDVSDTDPGTVRVLVVPSVDGLNGSRRLTYGDLKPSVETLKAIASYLDTRRVIGTRVVVEHPRYVGVTAIATLRAKRQAAPAEVERAALEALHRYYHPVLGGPDGTGWPFGRPIQAAELYAVLQQVPGVDLVEDSKLFSYDVQTRSRGESPVERIPIPPGALALSFNHEVRVERSL